MKIDELHDKLFDVLCVIDDICTREHIRYFLFYGTEIGAVREHDFIPWDDDMDLMVLAEDYPAFKKAMIENLPEHMHFCEPEQYAPDFLDFVPRVYDDRWLLRKEKDVDRYYKNYQNRVGADVFVLSCVPESWIGREMAYARVMTLYGLCMGRRYENDYEKYNPIQKIVVLMLSTIGKLIPMEWCWRRLCKVFIEKARPETPVRFNITFPHEHFFWKSEWFRETATAKIRGRDFPISAGYDAELRAIYGDYMAPPADRSIYEQHLDEEDQYQD